MQRQKEFKSGVEQSGKPFSTLDDALEIVPGLEKLAVILKELGGRRYPLSVRRGVISNMQNSRKSVQIKGSGSTYFLDIEQAKNGHRYLRITQSRKADGDEFERSSVYVFPEDAKELGSKLSEILAELAN